MTLNYTTYRTAQAQLNEGLRHGACAEPPREVHPQVLLL